MNGNITFFRDQKQDQGRTYKVSFNLQDGPHVLQFYSRSALDKLSLENCNKNPKYIESNISRCGGGLLVDTVEKNSKLWVKILIIDSASNSQDYFPPTYGVLLAPGYPPDYRPLPLERQETLQLPLNTHIILPVDEEAGEHFKRFHTYLKWFSPDLESLVLNTIRRPGLDFRLSRIEEKLGIDSDINVTATKNNFVMENKSISSRYQPPQSWKLVIICLASLTMLDAGLVAGSRYLPQLLSNKQQPTVPQPTVPQPIVPQPTVPQPTVPQPTVPQPTVPQPPETLESAVTHMISLLKDPTIQAKVPGLQQLWLTHFSPLEQKNLLNPPKINDLLQTDEFLWGVIKLQRLILPGPKLTDLKFLIGIDKYTKTRSVYDNQTISKLNDQQKDMLTVMVCNIKRGKEKLMNNNNNETIFKSGLSCEQMNTAMPLDGMRELNKSLESFKEGSG